MVIIVWLMLGFLSLGLTGIYFVLMARNGRKPWKFDIDEKFLPEISMIVPTFNEASVIGFKLLNISKLDYPNSLLHVIVVDSDSADGTLDIARDFARKHPSLNIECLSLSEKGKTAALNLALKHASCHVIVVSDADCFYERNMLKKTMPYLSAGDVGAISGVKLLLNGPSSASVRAEKNYLASMNGMKLGESKQGFTPLFEGGFSAYKIDAISSFDPYKTGSDDCGTIIKLAEEGWKAILVSEATFFTGFSTSWRERLKMKVRRANQLIRVFACYFSLLSQGRIRIGRSVILADSCIYLIGPILFVAFLVLTGLTFWSYPWLLLSLLVFFVPKFGRILFELCQSYLVLFVGLLVVVSGHRALVWSKPGDREALTQKLLDDTGLI